MANERTLNNLNLLSFPVVIMTETAGLGWNLALVIEPSDTEA